MEQNTQVKAKKVVVGVSGRHDSLVACLLLKRQGLDVIAVHIQTYPPGAYGFKKSPNCYLENLEELRDKLEEIKVPFYATDAASEFYENVMSPHVSAILQGRNSRLCFDCHQLRLMVLHRKMIQLKADLIATGHFAKLQKNKFKKEFSILRANDVQHDQSQYLAAAPADILKDLILPLGEMKKDEVLKIFNHIFTPLKELKVKNKNNSSVDTSQQNEINVSCEVDYFSNTQFYDQIIPTSFKKTGPIIHISTDVYYGEHDGIYKHQIGLVNKSFKSYGEKIDKSLFLIKYNKNNQCIYMGEQSFLSSKAILVKIKQLYPSCIFHKPQRGYCYISHVDKMIEANIFYKSNNMCLVEFSEVITPVIVGDVFVAYYDNQKNSRVIFSGLVLEMVELKNYDVVADFRTNEAKIEDWDEIDENAPKPEVKLLPNAEF